MQVCDLEGGNVGLVSTVDQEDEVAGGFAKRLRKGLPLMGLTAASLVVMGLTAGTATPAKIFVMFVMLLGGLTLASIPVLRTGNK